jgi:hypothetical protein
MVQPDAFRGQQNVQTAIAESPPSVFTFNLRLLRLDRLSYDAHMIADRFPQRGMFDVEAPGSVGVGGEAH